MKDKKSIAIVVLAAITAGVGIYSIVNNQSKLDAFTDLKNQHSAVAKERTKITKELQGVKAARDKLSVETIELGQNLSAAEQSVQTLTKVKTSLEEDITTINKKYVDELGKKTDELTQKNKELEQSNADLTTKTRELDLASKELTDTKASLKEKQDALATMKTENDAAIEQGKKAIAELETKYDGLNREKGALETKIASLNEDIEETNKKLEASEGDRTFLERELLRLQDEKAELVKKMNDIEFITAQYKRIKSDINIARRLDWMRRGIGHYAKTKTITEKYADLRRPDDGVTLAGTGEPLTDKIQVELTSNGEVKINGKIVAPKKEAEEAPEQPEADVPVAPTPVPTPAPGQD